MGFVSTMNEVDVEVTLVSIFFMKTMIDLLVIPIHSKMNKVFQFKLMKFMKKIADFGKIVFFFI